MSQSKSQTQGAQAPRRKRTAASRSGPIRNGIRTPPQPRTAYNESGDTSATCEDGVVEQAVKTAYRVIEDYMKRGEQAAWRNCPPHQGAWTMGQDGNYYGPDGMMRMWQDAMNNWAQMASSMMGGPWAQMWQQGGAWAPWMGSGWNGRGSADNSSWDTKGRETPFDYLRYRTSEPAAEKGWKTTTQGKQAVASVDEVSAAVQAATAAAFGQTTARKKPTGAVTVDVQTTAAHRAEVKFTMYRPVGTSRLELGPIETEDGKSKLSSKSAQLIQTDAGARIQLKIYARQTAATYEGMVRDAATGEVCGALEIILHDIDD